MRALLLAISLCTFIAGCGDSYLRGSVEPSSDGKTYLSVVDDNGSGCGPIKIDGKIWGHPIGQPGIISPGTHVIECGGEIEFDVPAGVVFKFDYWGP